MSDLETLALSRLLSRLTYETHRKTGVFHSFLDITAGSRGIVAEVATGERRYRICPGGGWSRAYGSGLEMAVDLVRDLEVGRG
jgi:hypothetical protein